MIIACYARKSNDKENDSINNQLSIIRSYIERQKELQGAEILQFSDDGASGINMNREAFQELLSKVRMREIDVVVVKDLSRLGRNYLDVCKLTDSIFPFMGIRLIAVSENYDSKYRSLNSMDLPTVFQSILNEYYVMESSKKVRNSCVMRIKSGEFIGCIPYGYFLKNKYTPVIDEEKVEIIREIFSLYLEKKTYIDVAKILNKRKILTNRGSKWTSEAIRKILKNEQYIGKRISLTYRKELKTKKKIMNNKSEWYINESAFPPIINRETFEKVQEILPESRMPILSGCHIMARKLYCAGCGKTLKRNGNFYCKNSYQTGENPCFYGALKREILYKEVLDRVKQFILIDIMDSKSVFSFSDIAKIDADITELKEEKARIFDSFFHNNLTEDEFKKQNETLSWDIAAKQIELNKCRKAVALETRYGSAERPIETLHRLYKADELTKEHMQFVKRINVFDSEHFEILLQDSSPLDVLCRNMGIYEEL